MEGEPVEKLIKGAELSDARPEERHSAVAAPFAFSIFVRKGHEECGDSAFVYCDAERLIAGVFDGVSGEPDAAEASSCAAQAALAYLKKQKRSGEKAMKEAMVQAHLAINQGYTTATLLVLEKDGAFIVSCVGDSPAYGINSKGEADTELPQARPVGDKDSVLKYLHYRNLVTSVIGPSGTGISMHARTGKLKQGEAIILATDGLSDNLYFKVKDGYVSDTAGTEDLKALIGKTREPERITSILASESAKRMAGARADLPDRMLVPKQDDIAIVAIGRK
jgi:serine/threonine protein phosphatase PrpC